MTSAATDRYFWTADNVRLHYLDFAGDDAGRPVLLCLPGLTRNARDFHMFGQRFAPRFRVLALSFRGRGDSGYAFDPLTYVPATYVQDVVQLMDEADARRFVIVGTSLGGIIGMLLTAAHGARVAGLVLNDCAPRLEAAGLGRIRQTVGRGDNWRSWLIAAREIARLHGAIYPDWTLEDWLPHAKRLCRLSREGRITWDYDPEITATLELAEAESDKVEPALWAALAGCRGRPLLSLRGELSDVITAATQAEMQARLPEMALATIPRVGHAPMLSELESIAALDNFLRRFE